MPWPGLAARLAPCMRRPEWYDEEGRYSIGPFAARSLALKISGLVEPAARTNTERHRASDTAVREPNQPHPQRASGAHGGGWEAARTAERLAYDAVAVASDVPRVSGQVVGPVVVARKNPLPKRFGQARGELVVRRGALQLAGRLAVRFRERIFGMLNEASVCRCTDALPPSAL
jgi:hypothetical protein